MARRRRRSLQPELDCAVLESRTLLSQAAMPAAEVGQPTSKFREIVIRGHFTILSYDEVKSVPYDGIWHSSNFKLIGFGRGDQLSSLKIDGRGIENGGWRNYAFNTYAMTFTTGRGDSFTVNCDSPGNRPSFYPGLDLRGTAEPSRGTGRFAGVKGKIHALEVEPRAGNLLPQGVHLMTFTLKLFKPLKSSR